MSSKNEDKSVWDRCMEVLKPITNPATPVDRRTSLRSLHLDDLDLVELVCDVEEEFGIEIGDDEALKFQTFDDLAACVDAHLARK